MKAINYIRLISLCIFVVPIVVINLCLFVSINYEIFENTIFTVDQIGRSGFSIPYIDGSLSISRAARTYPQYLLFKPGMIITAVLLILYWIKNNELFKEISNNSLKKNKYFLFFGVGSALFLISHSVLLGLNYENDLYKFFRRFVLLGFIIFEIAAQALLVLSIIQLKENLKVLINEKILKIKMFLVSILIIVAILSAPILNSSDYVHFKHALEWNYFLGVVSFYLLTFFMWKPITPPFHTPEGV